MDEKQINLFLKEECAFQEELQEVLSVLSKNMHGFLVDLNEISVTEHEEFQELLKNIEEQTKEIQNNVDLGICELTKGKSFKIA
jgi:hypothetical protein